MPVSGRGSGEFRLVGVQVNVSQFSTFFPHTHDGVVYLGPRAGAVSGAGLKVVALFVKWFGALALPVNPQRHGALGVGTAGRSAEKDLPQILGEGGVGAMVKLGEEAERGVSDLFCRTVHAGKVGVEG